MSELPDTQRLLETGEVWNFQVCSECGKPDRVDFIGRRVAERGFGCKYCRSPGTYPQGFIEPHPGMRDRISALIRMGRFNRYEVFA